MNEMNKVFRIVLLPIVFGAMMVLLTACPTKKPISVVDLGTIPNQYLATVPYKNGDIFKLQHENSRLVVDFVVSRHRTKQIGEGYGMAPSRFEPGPDYYFEYEVDQTVCKPNYPIFNVNIDFSNEYMRFDGTQGYDASNEKVAQLFGVGSVRFPFYGEDLSGYEVLDSLDINGRYFHDVFILKSNDSGYYDEEGMIYVDTYYYNYEKGLLGMVMSNGEKYWYYEN